MGHNLHRHDRPWLVGTVPALARVPTIDTLELSIVAFPTKPYHKLIKNAQPLRDAKPDPLYDGKHSERSLQLSMDRLRSRPHAHQEAIAYTAQHAHLPVHERAGWAQILGLGDEPDWLTLLEGRICPNAWQGMPNIKGWLFALAWLLAIDERDFSVMPEWARREYPSCQRLIDQLRGVSCERCNFCRAHHSPEVLLQRFYGFPSFRPTPALSDGRSAQRVLVERALKGQPSFGILPTGGGKSLCFQLPAIARYLQTGRLTVVISPLQSLMKDQVDQLRNVFSGAEALYSGIPSLKRPDIISRIRAGEVGMLYIAPEQFRNKSTRALLTSRDVEAIVFDEAHCLSEWGHDFRTDYRYVLRALREMYGGVDSIPPVFLYTATSQADATRQTLEHVFEETKQRPELFDTGAERDNLTYVVERCPESTRDSRVLELLQEHVMEGAAIIFMASRRACDELAATLRGGGYRAVAYHAGLEAEQRETIQNAFIAGSHTVVVATNAFGMGVDKKDVRLVVHTQMPGSLESYLQEAGRAGRDRQPSTAVLLWDKSDANLQFERAGMSQVTEEDLRALWRAIQSFKYRHNAEQQRVTQVTPRELLWAEEVRGHFEIDSAEETTRVKAAVNWLERSDVLQRGVNHGRFFQARPKREKLSDALAEVRRWALPRPTRKLYEAVLQAVYEDRDPLDADVIAEATADPTQGPRHQEGRRIFRALRALEKKGLIENSTNFGVSVARGVSSSSSNLLGSVCAREKQLLKWFEESDIDQMGGPIQVHSFQQIARMISSMPSVACAGEDVRKLLDGWRDLPSGWRRETEYPRFTSMRDHGTLEPRIPLSTLKELVQRRQAYASQLLDLVNQGLTGRGRSLYWSGSLGELVEQTGVLGFRGDDPFEAARQAFAWMHDLGIVRLLHGAAIFRSAMELTLLRGQTSEVRTLPQQHDALAEYSEHRILRVHVMNHWAQLMLVSPERGTQFVRDWFSEPVRVFLERYFPKKRKEVQRPLTEELHQSIASGRLNSEQRSVITGDHRRSHLVLAGPGSGKTLVLVHRVAWLLKVKSVRPRQIAVVCYTRSNASELRARLYGLVGNLSRKVMIRTLHGVAASIVGVGKNQSFADLLSRATEALAVDSDDDNAHKRRESLLGGIRYLFVDEYQDLDDEKYAFLSALTGRALTGTQHAKMRVFAVGDDDQSIFQYSNAGPRFLRAFEAHFHARTSTLRMNYRNPCNVLALAQSVVAPLEDRMKAAVTLVPDRDEGTLRRVRSATAVDAAFASLQSLLAVGTTPEDIAVLCREHAEIGAIRGLCEEAGVAHRYALPSGQGISMFRLLAVQTLWRRLERCTEESLLRGQIWTWIDQLPDDLWRNLLKEWRELLPERVTPKTAQYRLQEWCEFGRRSHMIGTGVTLSTVHAAKGRQFAHTIVVDNPRYDSEVGARNVLYVAMTRASESLVLAVGCQLSKLFRSLAHPTIKEEIVSLDAGTGRVRYETLGLSEDLYVDYLGLKASERAREVAHKAAVGDMFTIRGGFVESIDGVKIARLSRKARAGWPDGTKLRLLARTVRRFDGDNAYHKGAKRSRWLYPIFEAKRIEHVERDVAAP